MEVRLTRPIEEDLVALLPSGAELVADFDMVQLRTWSMTSRILAILPAPVRTQLELVGLGPRSDVDAVVMAFYRIGDPDNKGEVALNAAVLVRGEMPAELAAKTSEYRGVALGERQGHVFGTLKSRLHLWGSKAEVLRAIDLFRGEGESVRSARSDRGVRDALGRAPTAKVGRPALMAGVVISPTLLERLRKEKLFTDDIEWAAASLAVGQGFDIGAIWRARGAAEAQDQIGTLTGLISRWQSRMWVKAVGLVHLFDPVVLVPKNGEVHLAFRVPEAQLERSLSIFERVVPGPSGSASGKR